MKRTGAALSLLIGLSLLGGDFHMQKMYPLRTMAKLMNT